MKTKSILLSLLIPFAGLAQQTFDYHISAKIPQSKHFRKAYLFYTVGQEQVIDSTTMQYGAFTFSGHIKEPVKAKLCIGSNNYWDQQHDATELYLDKGTIQLAGTDSIKNARITGSLLNTEFKSYSRQMEPLETARLNNRQAYYRIPNYLRSSKTINDSLDAIDLKLYNQIKELNIRYVQTHPQSFLSLHLINNICGAIPDVSQMRTLFDPLNAGLKRTPTGESIQQRINELLTIAVGTTAPEFAVADTKGNIVKLSSFRGKYVLVDFWASWCHPCRAENPNVAKAYQRYKNKNFEVIGISLDVERDKAAWLDAIEKDGLTWINLCDLKGWKTNVAKAYHIQAVPQNFLIDPQGKIIGHNIKGEQLQQTLAKLFGEN